MEKEGHVLSVDFCKKVDTIRTDCTVTNPFTGVSCKFVAVWDTGAVKSVISPKVVQMLNLPSVGETICYGADGCSKTTIHSAHFTLPSGDVFRYVKPSLNFIGDDVLIGMDIISQGDFHISNSGGKTVFTFECTEGRSARDKRYGDMGGFFLSRMRLFEENTAKYAKYLLNISIYHWYINYYSYLCTRN